jgi:hypothetical protein
MKTDWKQTLKVWAFGFTKIPMILFTRPHVYTLNNQRCEMGIALTRRTQNHLGSIYFGTLGVGADLASGLLAMYLIEASPYRLSLVFKDVKAEFYKRVDGDAVFSCTDSEAIGNLIEEVHQTGERQHTPVRVKVTAPNKYGDEVLAEYVLTLSLKEIGT